MYKKRDSDGGKIHMGPIWDFNLHLATLITAVAANQRDGHLILTEFAPPMAG